MSLSPVDVEGGGDGGDIVAEINVTPLTDIFLVLLIIFMVTSTALTQQGTKVNLPRAGTGGSEPASIIITATADHRIELNGKTVALDALRSALQAALEKATEKHVILQGDRTVILEDAVQIMTIAKEAGAEKLAIATEPQATKR
ncbi:MAG: biopolymer transporter ExbD [Deltaproteobacteria bacterium]|nr:biopolymer transporter ExbD [Deltaproteobacteria bacterium]MBI3387602.1 biopolymer transporter ExbD [Deltaproteobacteria bacterium]